MPYDPRYQSSRTSSHPGYDHNQTFVRYSTGPKDSQGWPVDPETARQELFDERRRAESSQRYSKTHSRHVSSIPSQSSHASAKTIGPVDESSQASTARLNRVYDPPQPQRVRSNKSVSTARRLRLPSGSVSVPRGPGSFRSGRHQDDMEPFDRLPSPDHNSPQAFTTPGFDPRLWDTESRRASSPQGPDRGPSSHELTRIMDNASLSERSGSRRSGFMSGGHGMDLESAKRHTVERYPADPWGSAFNPDEEAMRDEMRHTLGPLKKAALRYVEPTRYIEARGAVVIATERIIEEVMDRTRTGPQASSNPLDVDRYAARRVAGSFQGSNRTEDDPRQQRCIDDGSHNRGASPARSATWSSYGYESLPYDGAGREPHPSLAGSQRSGYSSSGYSSRNRVDSTHGPPEEDFAPSHPHGSIHGSTQRGPSEPRGHRPSMYSERPHAPRRRRYADSEYGIQ